MSSERRIERPGSDVVYTVVGEGPPVVLGHSLFCNRDMWKGVVNRLSSKFTFINVALRGHGESSATAPFTIWDLADDWVAILDQESIEAAALCGLSTGGMTAMRMALKMSERVCGLALVDTDADAEASLWKRIQYGALGSIYRRTGFIPVGTVTKAMFAPETRRDRPELIDELVELIKTFDRHQIRHATKAIFGRDSVDVSSIGLPTLVVVGEHDHSLPPARSRKLAASIEGARLEVIKAAGHLTAIEQPDVLADLLEAFLPECFV